jgi:DNA polymerase III subunit chi
MTRVDFYHDADDRLVVAARLAQKGVTARKRLWVATTDAEQAQHLDRTLWTFSPLAFVPHALADSPLEAESPVVISQKIPVNATLGYDILINLGSTLPEQALTFSRVIEIVSRSDADIAQARERYRRYREMGCEMVAHRLGQ